ncbi:MAG: hypothetical protein QGG36_05120 [Pirellulaceae bacterium]|jgi:hypothetical protein|nr:hypothetical protein [Pirellulaceae bacterium]
MLEQSRVIDWPEIPPPRTLQEITDDFDRFSHLAPLPVSLIDAEGKFVRLVELPDPRTEFCEQLFEGLTAIRGAPRQLASELMDLSDGKIEISHHATETKFDADLSSDEEFWVEICHYDLDSSKPEPLGEQLAAELTTAAKKLLQLAEQVKGGAA